VQVAAFDDAAPARALATKLRGQGFEARVDADGPWHRVRVGFYATRGEAAALAKRLKEQGVEGFVTGVGGR
jgi:cell division protein FtsN